MVNHLFRMKPILIESLVAYLSFFSSRLRPMLRSIQYHDTILIVKRPSGKFVIRMPQSLHGSLRDEAARAGESLNQICLKKLREQEPPGAAAPGPILADFLESIVHHWQENLEGLVLFGSTARGEATAESDIDLLLVMGPGVKITRGLYHDWEAFCRDYGGPQNSGRISPHFVVLPGTVGEAGGLWYETAIEGILLWAANRRVSNFLRQLREAMAQGKIRRRMLHGSPYWVKEP
jgi:hypothetical protein